MEKIKTATELQSGQQWEKVRSQTGRKTAAVSHYMKRWPFHEGASHFLLSDLTHRWASPLCALRPLHGFGVSNSTEIKASSNTSSVNNNINLK